ncbi:MAG TPA: hypothetical protein VGB17_09500 [Pyrinomonadaceae bacterium]
MKASVAEQVLPEPQHIPKPSGDVPGGQLPSHPGVVQLWTCCCL